MGDTYTIQLSPRLVNRLASDGEKPKKKTKKPKPKIPKDSQQPQSTVKPAPSIPMSPSPSGGWPIQPPMFLPQLPPPPPPPPEVNAELEAIRAVLKESGKVLEKLERQEANMVQELTQRAKDLRDKEFTLPYQKPMPCMSEKQACVECYKEHAEEPLKCAQAVKAFAECTRLTRQQVGSAPDKKVMNRN